MNPPAEPTPATLAPRCEHCRHWARHHRLTEFGICALCATNPHIGPHSAHASRGEWDKCPEFAPRSAPVTVNPQFRFYHP